MAIFNSNVKLPQGIQGWGPRKFPGFVLLGTLSVRRAVPDGSRHGKHKWDMNGLNGHEFSPLKKPNSLQYQ